MFAACLWGLSWLSVGAETREPDFPAGSLIVLENCNSFVEGWTHSSVGHVALVFPEESQDWVFEATPGRVRKVSLTAYQQELAELNERRRDDILAKIYSPREPYSEEELCAMRCYLETQLGRRYSISNYGRNRVGDGIHCAELAANTLNCSGRFVFERCHRETPGSLTTKIAEDYHPGVTWSLTAAKMPSETWCARSWRRWTGYGQWCRWSCGEAWSWCW
jgi:hypothetical protein